MFPFTDAHSLHFDFSITAKGEPWCKGQVLGDEKVFLSYDCGSNEVRSMILLREGINAMNFRKVRDTLGDVTKQLRQEVAEFKPDTDVHGGK